MATTKNEPLPTIYYGAMELHGDLFFASLEFHDLVETLPVVHNYALTYALDLCTAESGRVTPLYWTTERRKQQPRYADDFAALTQAGIYVTPAKSPDGLPPTAIRQYATRVDEYLHAQRKIDDVLSWEPNPNKRKANTLASLFPLHGYLKVITVGARFLFYAYNLPPDFPLQRYIRLGKFNSKAAVTLRRCPEIAAVENTQMTTHPVNLIDMPETIPLNLLTMRPTPLAMVAHLPGAEVLKVVHPHPWKNGASITAYLPRAPHYGVTAIGETRATVPDKSRKAAPKRRTRP
jgi:CRISPR-associated protein Csc1